MDPKKAAFIRANTSVMAPPHVPEIRLHLASEAHELWSLTEEELDAAGVPPPYWAFAWAGGQGLARYVLDHPDVARGRRVADFATGCGLVGIAAALSGARHVAAVDIDPFCGTAVTLNAALNGVPIEFDGRDLIGTGMIDVDVMLAGDVFFDREMAARITPWFERLAGKGMTILVGDPGRSYLPRDHLTLLAEYEVPVTRALEDGEVKRTVVWRFD